MDDLQAIDNQIASLEAQIVKLKTRRNSLAPLCRLPLELVVRIFKFVQNSNEGNENRAYTGSPNVLSCKTSTSGYDIDWNRVTRVCTYLRRIALDARELWAVLYSLQLHFTYRFPLMPGFLAGSFARLT
jgi:hypothetical protein